jgi:hypothetical protein
MLHSSVYSIITQYCKYRYLIPTVRDTIYPVPASTLQYRYFPYAVHYCMYLLYPTLPSCVGVFHTLRDRPSPPHLPPLLAHIDPSSHFLHNAVMGICPGNLRPPTSCHHPQFLAADWFPPNKHPVLLLTLFSPVPISSESR